MAGKEVGLGDLMVVKFLSRSQPDLGSSFATIASNCDTEKETSARSSAEREDSVPIILVIINMH